MNDNIEDSSLDQPEISQEGMQIVTFSLNGSRFAAPMCDVQEIVRVPTAVRVPMASPHLIGLSNLRGRVLPVFECRSMMGMPSQSTDESSRVLVLRLNSPVGLVVDRVHSVMSVNDSDFEALNHQDQHDYSEWLSGMVRTESGLILILDIHRLVDKCIAVSGQVSRSPTSDWNSDTPVEEDEDDSDEWQLVSFEVDGQEYAAPIERVQEIVQAPTDYTRVPHSPYGVLGVMVLRARLLPLVSLRALFGLPALDIEESHRVVVLQIAPELSVGVVMDRVNEVLRVPRGVVEPIPTLFGGQSEIKHLSAMCRLQDGKRLVSVMDVDSLMQHAMAYGSAAEASGLLQHVEEGDSEMTDAGQDDDGQVVVFRLGDEEFGVNIHSVQEIVRVPEQLTKIPQAPDFLEGVINLRGSVLPVVDQRRRMGIPSSERHDRQRIMVYLMQGVRTGFVVDSVTEVLRIENRHVSDTPADVVHTADLIPKVANLPHSKRMILLIDPKALLSGAEIRAVKGHGSAQASEMESEWTPELGHETEALQVTCSEVAAQEVH